jgi:hypothetical protein
MGWEDIGSFWQVFGESGKRVMNRRKWVMCRQRYHMIMITVPGLSDALVWPKPWSDVIPTENSDGRLKRECCSGHPLYNKRAILIAGSNAADDHIYFLPDGPRAFALVHHTNRRETDPQWPAFTLYDTLEDLFAAEMMGEPNEED